MEKSNDVSKNPNFLICEIIRNKRYDLLKDIKISIDEDLEELVDILLKDDDALYFMHKNNFFFTEIELNFMCNIVFKKYHYSYNFEEFIKYFFTKDQLNVFISKNEQFFKNYILEKKENVSYYLKGCDKFIEIILKNGYTELIFEIENYSLSNLKLLAKINLINLPYYLGNDRFAERLFELKSNLDPNDFCKLLDLLKEKSSYDKGNFSNLIINNIDFLINMVTEKSFIPQCLIESDVFRNECIKRNKISLATKCILPMDIINDEDLMGKYCNELNISTNDFLNKMKWLSDYYKKNNNIFNTFLATSLKLDIPLIHFERFINDVEIQRSLSKLNLQELNILNKILTLYSYDLYDIAPMIVNIINNIGDYKINLETEEDLKSLIRVLQLPYNQYQINDINGLNNYSEIKKEYFLKRYHLSDLNTNKDNLLKALFNITLEEGIYINSKYCHNFENLSKELDSTIYNYLVLINKIIECSDNKVLFNILQNSKEYELEIPFESYLRSKYTELYSKSLYKVFKENDLHENKDSILKKVSFNSKNIQISIPRADFHFLVHCVASCSLLSDITDSNYKNDWLYRPQLQDHFIACSYINEKGIYSIRSQGNIIFGFDKLESGSILSMGNTDIDSIGRYSCRYNGQRELQKRNGERAKYFTPAELLKTINDGYNEVVIERRNNLTGKELKRKPDYIIMMAESLDDIVFLEEIFQNQLSFINDYDKNEVKKTNNYKELLEILSKYSDKNNKLNNLANLIMKAKYYEECLKAASDFDIPLIIIDKTYYFKRLLDISTYDENTKNSILNFYFKAKPYERKKIFNMVAKAKDITELIKEKTF